MIHSFFIFFISSCLTLPTLLLPVPSSRRCFARASCSLAFNSALFPVVATFSSLKASLSSAILISSMFRLGDVSFSRLITFFRSVLLLEGSTSPPHVSMILFIGSSAIPLGHAARCSFQISAEMTLHTPFLSTTVRSLVYTVNREFPTDRNRTTMPIWPLCHVAVHRVTTVLLTTTPRPHDCTTDCTRTTSTSLLNTMRTS